MSAVMSIQQALSSGIDELTYRSYAAQRLLGHAPERLSKHFPNVEAMEARFRREGVPIDDKEDLLRERFDAWAKAEGWDTESDGLHYDDERVQWAWYAVKAFRP